MTPITIGAIATAGGGALLLVGWWLRDRGARRTERLLRDRLAKAQFAADQRDRACRRFERDLDLAERANKTLLVQVAEALRIIADLTDARLDDAADPFRGQWVAPTPQAWAAFQEGHEKAREN